MLPDIRVTIEVFDDVAVVAFRRRPGLQLRVEVRMPLQVLVNGVTDGLIARGSAWATGTAMTAEAMTPNRPAAVLAVMDIGLLLLCGSPSDGTARS